MKASIKPCNPEMFPDIVLQDLFVTIMSMMQSKFVLLICIVALVSGAPYAADTETLQAAFQNALDQLKEKNLEGFLDCWHKDAVLYTREDIFPIDRGASEYDEWADILEDFFARIVTAEFRPQTMKYRVTGDVGMVWGRTRFAVDLKHGGGSDFDSRLTAVFARTADGWKIINWHSSAVPRQSSAP
jgi:ketosteroid isomerase-like protein